MRQCQPLSIRVGKTSLSATGELYTLTIDSETAPLVPFKNWNQLDLHKWTARGKLPGTPAGLEVGPDHVKLAGESVSINDPHGCAKLEKLFTDWLALEWSTLELAKKPRSRPSSTVAEVAATAASPGHRFRVERDRRGQVHIHCLEGAHTLTTIGLTVAGFHSLDHQGLMRKPRTLQVGALHDWIEIDGIIYYFKDGQDDSARFEQLLNERYVVEAHGDGHNIAIFENPVSATGFDIQFPALIGGVLEQHRVHLTDESVALLQDQTHCGLLHKRIIVKLIPPNLVFKQKTADGGEENLPKTVENIVRIDGEQGADRLIDLSQPLNLLRVSAPELGAVFNHPSINQRVRLGHLPLSSSITLGTEDVREVRAETRSSSTPLAEALTAPDSSAARIEISNSPPSTLEVESDRAPAPSPALPSSNSNSPQPVSARQHTLNDASSNSDTAIRPNLWLKPLLAVPSARHDWFACLIYSQIAQKFGNSHEGKFGPSKCWYSAFGEALDIGAPAFKGIFLTEKGSLGFLHENHLARFYNKVAFLGTQHSTLEGVGITLIAVGLDLHQNIVFILTDDYARKFGVPDSTLATVLGKLNNAGAVVSGRSEVLASDEPIDLLWTVPAEQTALNDPQALESVRPGANPAGVACS